MRLRCLVVCVVSWWLLVDQCPSQVADGVPVERVIRVPPGGLVDLDTGAVLPQAALRPLQADLQFDRDGEGFFVLPLHGGMAASEHGTRPDGEDWAKQRGRLGRHDAEPRTWFVRTDRGAVARVTASVADPYSTASGVLQWVLAPPALPVFLPGPADLRARWRGPLLDVAWAGDAPRWLVEVQTGQQSRKVTVAAPRCELAELDPAAVHRITVRGLHEGGVVSMPADVVQHGLQRAPVRGTVAYGDRWYDAQGGLSLPRAEAAGEDADVVFYLYGVYVPGGGVQKVGSGRAAWLALAELPERGYLPSYGRIDEGDVLAVRLADGRYAKIWLVPVDGRDVRNGMAVHFAFLADGRRHLLPAPAALRFEAATEGVKIGWDAVTDAVAYDVREPGKDAPTRVAGTSMLLAGLAANRMFPIEITAVKEDGETSDPLAAEVHTFGPGYRVGRFRLEVGRTAIRFADGETVAHDAADGDLRIDNSAGGASSLGFWTRHGAGRPDNIAFGDFAGADSMRHAPTIQFDDDQAGSELFVVRTAGGGLASVRVGRRNYPQVEFDYVLQLPSR